MGRADETRCHEAGFDLVPRLSRNDLDLALWDMFIANIWRIYGDAGAYRLQTTYSCIKFYADNGLVLPFDGWKFLRFSSKIRGFSRYGDGERLLPTFGGEPPLPSNEPVPVYMIEAQTYLQKVVGLARAVFGTRARAWDTRSGTMGFYAADAAVRSIEAYYQVSCLLSVSQGSELVLECMLTLPVVHTQIFTRRARPGRCLVRQQHRFLLFMAACRRSHMQYHRRSRQGFRCRGAP